VKAFVVAYHPSDESFHRAVLDRVLAGLRAGGAEVRVADLAAEGFRGELSLDEWRAYRTPLAPGDRADVDAHVDALRWCDTLVFVYPTWWSGQPAALTGWLDRVFGNGVAWSFPPGARRPQPLLGNIGRVVGVTTHGSSKLINAVQGEPGKRVLSRAVRGMCRGLRTRFTWLAMYGVDRSTRAERQAFLDRVERQLAAFR
jgi:putative NADPH-quinone reductase